MIPSYADDGNQDPYTYPESPVLLNKWGIEDGGVLSQLEYSATRMRIDQLRAAFSKEKFDLAHLQAIHRHIFQDVYEWAGDLRTISLSKGGSPFAQPEYIESSALPIFARLKNENFLKGKQRGEFEERLAFHFSEINAIHPFREGNGRAIQTFLDILARQAGYGLDFSGVDRASWNDAARESFRGNLAPVTGMFARILEDKTTDPQRAILAQRKKSHSETKATKMAKM